MCTSHPGVTNAFLIRTRSPLALEYNDRSVLESFHCSVTFHILSQPACDLLKTLGEEDRRRARELIISTIMATDMAFHHAQVGELSQFAAGAAPARRGSWRGSAGGERSSLGMLGGVARGAQVPVEHVLKAYCHLADLGNTVLRWDLSLAWSHRVCDEATALLVEEARLGLPLPSGAKLGKHTREELAARQLVFIDDWVHPLFKVAAMLFPGARSRLRQIELNREECKAIMAQHRKNSAKGLNA